MIVLTGASASGKTETAKALYKLFNIKKFVTHTTRPMRVGEVQDSDYHFVTKEEFLRLKNEGAFIETTEYNHNYYGSSKAEMAYDKVLIVETTGARTFLNLNDPKLFVYRLITSRKMRAKRMYERGDAPEVIKERLTNDVTRFADENFKDPRIIDVNTEKLSIDEVATYIYNDYKKRIKNIQNKNSGN